MNTFVSRLICFCTGMMLVSCEKNDSHIGVVAREYIESCIGTIQEEMIYKNSFDTETVDQNIKDCESYSVDEFSKDDVRYFVSESYEFQIENVIFNAVNVHVLIEFDERKAGKKYVLTLLDKDDVWKVYSIAHDLSGH